MFGEYTFFFIPQKGGISYKVKKMMAVALSICILFSVPGLQLCARAAETIDEPSDNEQDINEIPNNTQDTDETLDIVQEVLEEEQIQDSGVNTTADILMDGNGTPESPYLVRTPEDLDRYPL